MTPLAHVRVRLGGSRRALDPGMYCCVLVLCAPAAIGIAASHAVASGLAAAGRPLAPRLEHGLRLAAAIVAVLGVLAVVLEGVGGDLQHLFWTTLFALVCVFTASGPAASRFATASGRRSELRAKPQRALWLVFCAFACLAVLPIATTALAPETRPPIREPGASGAKIVELAAFGLGAARPAWLAPRTESEVERGLAHLSRDVTVPMGTLLVAAWMSIVLCAALLVVRFCVAQRWRGFAVACVPPTAAFVVACWPPGFHELGGLSFDTGWFGPFSALHSGMWSSDPAVLRGFGPVVAAATGAAFVLALVQLADAWLARRRAR